MEINWYEVFIQCIGIIGMIRYDILKQEEKIKE